MPFKEDPEKFCEICGNQFWRKRTPSGRFRDRGSFLKQRYCSWPCQYASNIKDPNDMSAGGLRDRARKFRGTSCEICGGTTRIAIHHRNHDPRDNSPENLQTLCTPCHNSYHFAGRKRAWRSGPLLPFEKGV